MSLASRLAAVREGIADAASRAGREPDELTTIVVTKFHPAALARELVEFGVRDLGENRNQEAEAKARELADLSLTWHFVGQLQTNKARRVRRYADVVHSVDRPELVDALASEESELSCFVQVNLTADPARGGVSESGVDALAEKVLEAPGLRLLGVMAVAPLDEDAVSAFERLRRASDRVKGLDEAASCISAGMSHDYVAAIAAGATHLRIGSAITGERPARH